MEAKYQLLLEKTASFCVFCWKISGLFLPFVAKNMSFPKNFTANKCRSVRFLISSNGQLFGFFVCTLNSIWSFCSISRRWFQKKELDSRSSGRSVFKGNSWFKDFRIAELWYKKLIVPLTGHTPCFQYNEHSTCYQCEPKSSSEILCSFWTFGTFSLIFLRESSQHCDAFV